MIHSNAFANRMAIKIFNKYNKILEKTSMKSNYLYLLYGRFYVHIYVRTFIKFLVVLYCLWGLKI